MSSLYLDERLDLAEIVPGDTVTLSGDEARHALTVARVRLGERLLVGDGRGSIVHGAVVTAGSRELEVLVDSVRREEAPTVTLTLVQALAKGDRDELAVQASTELGVDRIVPWAASRSVSRWEGAKVDKGRARWAAIAREAAKQSIRARVPQVIELATTSSLVQVAASARMLLLEPTASTALSELTLDERNLVLVVGPEGGIADAELDRLHAAGAESVRLGASVLRTSTAGPAAIAALSIMLRRW